MDLLESAPAEAGTILLGDVSAEMIGASIG
jgi:hypothetical protein